MKTLEERQHEMRERNQAPNSSDEVVVAATPRKLRETPSDVRGLKQKIAELEKRVLLLEAENKSLRTQKTIVVERPSQKSYSDAVKEQQRNFFKYSNARRY
jgi:cell division protein FtsB